jgi:hypothetical protein
MYDQLDPDTIDTWPVDGLEVTVNGAKFVIRVEAADLTLSDLQLHIENMYDQLDPRTIDSWPVDGMDVWADGENVVIRVEAA